MKKAWMVMVVLGIVILGTVMAASADPGARLVVNIGFSFYAGDQQLPAGEYWIELRTSNSWGATGSVVVIRSLEGAAYHMVLARPETRHTDDSAAFLLFNHVGGSYFLTKVHSGSLESVMQRSRTEKSVKLAYARDWLGDSAEVVKVLAIR